MMRRAGHPALAAMMGDRAHRYNIEAAYVQAIGDRDGTLFQFPPRISALRLVSWSIQWRSSETA